MSRTSHHHCLQKQHRFDLPEYRCDLGNVTHVEDSFSLEKYLFIAMHLKFEPRVCAEEMLLLLRNRRMFLVAFRAVVVICILVNLCGFDAFPHATRDSAVPVMPSPSTPVRRMHTVLCCYFASPQLTPQYVCWLSHRPLLHVHINI